MNMEKVLPIILSVLLFFSCGNDSKIKKELKILQSQSIIIPNNVKVLINGKDTVMNSFMDSELKLIFYIDSAGCSSCAIKDIYLWNDFVEYAEEFDNRLKYYFIFSPKKNDEYSVRFALKTNNFDYPVILDSKGEFKKRNPHIPKNPLLHTFLLDKDNKVILVGNPLNNPKIEEMFYKIVEERLK